MYLDHHETDTPCMYCIGWIVNGKDKCFSSWRNRTLCTYSFMYVFISVFIYISIACYIRGSPYTLYIHTSIHPLMVVIQKMETRPYVSLKIIYLAHITIIYPIWELGGPLNSHSIIYFLPAGASNHHHSHSLRSGSQIREILVHSRLPIISPLCHNCEYSNTNNSKVTATPGNVLYLLYSKINI